MILISYELFFLAITQDSIIRCNSWISKIVHNLLDYARSLSSPDEADVHGFDLSQWNGYRANSGSEQRELLINWATNPRVTSSRTKYLIGQDNWSHNLLMELEHIDARNSPGHEDVWGVYGIAGVRPVSHNTVEYFNYQGSAKGSYCSRNHIGMIARMNAHLDILASPHDEILASQSQKAVRYTPLMTCVLGPTPIFKCISWRHCLSSSRLGLFKCRSNK